MFWQKRIFIAYWVGVFSERAIDLYALKLLWTFYEGAILKKISDIAEQQQITEKETQVKVIIWICCSMTMLEQNPL